ncbi:hypothetical protein H072_9366 [Dactylellina haptotyla CBS 200.50]|uniref:Conserved oligomeric Golgi complex subunit 6 n=1 Tax=Dactylellina haptotyla (strain CBS 200.50) TaxID=1284197 RepID=S8A7B9_DACHA|nr:hypothetical protein H072_9366 [Dactylellina haptotyla CBS 200.50]
MANSEILLPFDDRDEQFVIDGIRLQEGTGTRSNHLPAKAAYIISTSATDPDIKEVLLAFDSIIENNNADNRRRLRAQILQELAGSNSQVVQNFGLIAAQVDNIGNALKVLHTNFNDITKRVDAGTFEINAAIQESDTTLAERQRLNNKEIVLHAFLEKFTLPVAHLANITSSPQSLDDDFFDTLDRVKGIHSDCQILLGSESTRAGVDIMDQMTKNLNSAYQKVYLWLQRELKFLSFETPVGNRQVRKALEVLTNRPALLQSCIDTLAEARQRSLYDSFNHALTGGDGDALGTKPIDMMAHDPIRYTGDMLAWLHSALVGELEALQAIFELPPNPGRTNRTIEGEIRIPLDSELHLRDHVRPLADKSLETALSTFRVSLT